MKRILNKENIIKIAYVIISFIFTIPSIMYLIENKSIYRFSYIFKYMFQKETTPLSNCIDVVIYVLFFSILFYLYYFIIKNINNFFKSNKSMYIYIVVIAALFLIIIPITSYDVYSYIGNGWVDFKYSENPYYTSVQQVWDKNGPDQMLGKVARCWRNEPVIYGPAWSIICKTLTSLSFGNITAALYIFKFATLIIFVGSLFLIYKITKKKIFVAMFGLNPYILFEFLSNVHNDIFLVFFVLLSIYFIKNRKNVILSVACVAIATAIKYLSILLLPFIIIYALKDENIKNKIIKTIIYGLEFLVILCAFYLIYIRDLNVLAGIFIQQNKYGRSIFLGIYYLLNGDQNILRVAKIIALGIFAISYVTIVFKLFFTNKTKELKFSKLMRVYQIFLFLFTFVLITNFNAWYVIWLFPTLFFQKAKNIRYTLYLSAGVIYSYAISYATKIDNETVGIPYLIVMICTVIVLSYVRKNNKKVKQ